MTVQTVEVKPPPAPVLWFSVLPRLLLAAFIGASAWAFILQWLIMRQQPVSVVLLMMAHFGYGGIAAALVCGSGTGITWPLRLTVAAVIILAVLAGNVWGFRMFLAQRFPGISWTGVIEAYFKVQLVHRQTVDLKCMVAAGLGALVGVAAMQKAGAKYVVVKPQK